MNSSTLPPRLQPLPRKKSRWFLLLLFFLVLLYLVGALVIPSIKNKTFTADWKFSWLKKQPKHDVLNYNTLYKVTGISQSTDKNGVHVVWDDSTSANVFLNNTESPYDISSKDSVQDGDSVVIQIPRSPGNTNQGCTTNCGQYGCRVLVLTSNKDATWGHGGILNSDKTCGRIKSMTKIELKKGNKDNTYVITDGVGTGHNVIFTPV